MLGFDVGFAFAKPIIYGSTNISPAQSQAGMEKTMSLGLVGRKVGMMRIFTEDGDSIPVTVLDVSNNRVTQIKTPEVDGYSAVQVTLSLIHI